MTADQQGLADGSPDLDQQPALVVCASDHQPGELVERVLDDVRQRRPDIEVLLAHPTTEPSVRQVVERLAGDDREVVVVPLVLSGADDVVAEAQEATREVPGALCISGLGPHPLLSGAVVDRARAVGAGAGAGIVIATGGPQGAASAAELATDLAQVVYDVDAIWVGPVVAGFLGGGEPTVVDAVHHLGRRGIDVCVVSYVLDGAADPLDPATHEQLEEAGATAFAVLGLEQRVLDVVRERYEQGVAEIRAGLDEDLWQRPLR